MKSPKVRRRSAGAMITAVLLASPLLSHGQEAAPNGRETARKLRLTAEPRHPFRYNNGTGPYGNATETLLERGRRAFSPGERVRLSFRLPADAKLTDPFEARAALALHDLDGRKIQDGGEASLRATASGVEGALDWTVPEAPEGSYFLVARFKGKDDKLLATRSDVVFLAPEYPRLLETVEKVTVDAKGLPPLLRDVSLPSTMMLVEDARMRFEDFGHAPRDWDHIKRQLATAREYAQALARGEDPYRDKTGLLVKAYRSEVDDTLQPYGLYVPKSYDPKKAYPLLVSLHGATSNHLLNRRRVFGLGNRPGESDFEAIRNEDVAFPDVDYIVLTPYGRGEVAGYNGLGGDDVLRALDDVQRAYNVDPDRVYLTGLSMGGGGTWHLGLRYPDRFAAIVPVCAVGDATLFGFTQGASADERALMDLTGPTVLAENALNQKVLIFHGDEDPVVIVEHSRRMVERYRSLGMLGKNVEYFEQPGVNHFAWDFAYRDASLFPRLSGVRRDPFPERVVYTTHSPRYNKAYWLRIDRIDKGFRVARIEGVRASQRFEIKTDNLSAFSLLLDPKIAAPGKAVEVMVDGRSAWRGVPSSTTLSLARDASGRWSARAWKGPSVGPPDHPEVTFINGTIAQSSRHAYVYGTAGGPEATAAARAAAGALADWGSNVRALFPVVADTDVTPQMMATHNLVVVGNASVNRIAARMASALPLRQDATGTFAGPRRVASADAAFRLHHQNPLAAGRYVLWFSAGTAEGFKRFRPAPGVRPPSPLADYVVVEADGKVALEGFFKDDWLIAAR